MPNNSFFRDPRVQFKKRGPSISEPEIAAAIPESFVGKKEFIRFYLRHNGGYFKDFAFIYRDAFQKVQKGQVNSLGIIGFFFIPRKPGDKVQGFRSILEEKEGLREGYSKNKWVRSFIGSHIPIACDGSGDDHWIEIPTGRIRFLDMESVDKGPIEVAPSFQEFVSNLLGDWRDEDKI